MSYYIHLLNQHGLRMSKETIKVRMSVGLAVDLKEVVDEVKRPYYGGGNPRTATTDEGDRICSECRELKPRESYTKNKNKTDGLDARCRDCKKLIARLRYLEKKAA